MFGAYIWNIGNSTQILWNIGNLTQILQIILTYVKRLVKKEKNAESIR